MKTWHQISFWTLRPLLSYCRSVISVYRDATYLNCAQDRTAISVISQTKFQWRSDKILSVLLWRTFKIETNFVFQTQLWIWSLLCWHHLIRVLYCFNQDSPLSDNGFSFRCYCLSTCFFSENLNHELLWIFFRLYEVLNTGSTSKLFILHWRIQTHTLTVSYGFAAV